MAENDGKWGIVQCQIAQVTRKKRWSRISVAAEVGLGRLSRTPLLPPLKQLGDKYRGKQRLVSQIHLLQQVALTNASNKNKTYVNVQ